MEFSSQCGVRNADTLLLHIWKVFTKGLYPPPFLAEKEGKGKRKEGEGEKREMLHYGDMLSVTWLGEEVDEGICLTALIEICQLRAAAQAEIVNPKSPLATDGGVENSTLQSDSQNV